MRCVDKKRVTDEAHFEYKGEIPVLCLYWFGKSVKISSLFPSETQKTYRNTGTMFSVNVCNSQYWFYAILIKIGLSSPVKYFINEILTRFPPSAHSRKNAVFEGPRDSYVYVTFLT